MLENYVPWSENGSSLSQKKVHANNVINKKEWPAFPNLITQKRLHATRVTIEQNEVVLNKS